ncbi:MAG: hypothetical protein AAGM46_27230, partial [Cyanobacteria bacterium J06582_2]
MAKTIQSYKSILADVIRTAFGVDFADDVFSKMYKSMALLRPSPRLSTLTWSMDKVLDLIVTWDNLSCSLRLLLQKTIFLIAYATGSRNSEIHALRRGDSFS